MKNLKPGNGPRRYTVDLNPDVSDAWKDVVEAALIEACQDEYVTTYFDKEPLAISNHFLHPDFEELNHYDAEALEFSIERRNAVARNATKVKITQLTDVFKVINRFPVYNVNTVQRMIFHPALCW